MKIIASAVQVGPFAGDYQENIARISGTVEKAVAATGAGLVCLTELMTVPYFCAQRGRDYLDSYAETIPGPASRALAGVARQRRVAVVGSAVERRDDGENGAVTFYNSAFILTPDGEPAGTYRKTHLPRLAGGDVFTDEPYFFSPGNELRVFEISGITASGMTARGVKLGVLICYDRSFPEAWRVLTLGGAQVVFVLSASWGFRGDAFVDELRVRALENGVFVVAANKAGDETVGGEPFPRHHFGRSCIIDPFGQVTASLDDTPWTYVSAELDFAKVEEARARLPFLRDRRPDLYGACAATSAVRGGAR